MFARKNTYQSNTDEKDNERESIIGGNFGNLKKYKAYCQIK
jgi:hypothetical protein